MRLDELCSLVVEHVEPALQPETLYVGLEHLQPGRMERLGGGCSTEMHSSKSRFRKGDVLYGKLRPYLDKAIVADGGGMCTTELLVLRPSAGTDAKFLTGVLHSRGFIEHAMSGVTGVQHPRTSWQRIREFRLPRFEEADQRAIGYLIRVADRAITACDASTDNLSALKRAAMHALFTRGLRGEPQKETEVGPIPEGWKRISIAELGSIVTGTTPPTKEQANYEGGTIPFVAPGDFQDGASILHTEKFITHQGLRYARPLPRGSTCFVSIGATIGKVGFIELNLCAHNQQINAVIPNRGTNASFVFYLLTYCSQYIKSFAAPGPMPILSKGVFESIELYMPADPDEQAGIANILEMIDEGVRLHNLKRAVLEELFKALLNPLMTGEISVSDLNLSALEGREQPKATPESQEAVP